MTANLRSGQPTLPTQTAKREPPAPANAHGAGAMHKHRQRSKTWRSRATKISSRAGRPADASKQCVAGQPGRAPSVHLCENKSRDWQRATEQQDDKGCQQLQSRAGWYWEGRGHSKPTAPQGYSSKASTATSCGIRLGQLLSKMLQGVRSTKHDDDDDPVV